MQNDKLEELLKNYEYSSNKGTIEDGMKKCLLNGILIGMIVGASVGSMITIYFFRG